MTSWRLSYFEKFMFSSKIGMFSVGNIERMLAQVPFLIMICIIIWTKTCVKTVLEQTCTLAHFSDVTDKQLFGHPLYNQMFNEDLILIH